MKFYTNVQAMGNHILYRGVENGKRIKHRIPFNPTLYVKSKKSKTKFRTLKNEPLEPITFNGIYEARDFVKRYAGTPNFNIYGNQGWSYNFISEDSPEQIEFDPDLISVAQLDIEVDSSNGFPNIDYATSAVTAITLLIGGIYHVWGLRGYEPERPDVEYHLCQDEKSMLISFFDFWNKNCPDIITGWNVELFDIPYLINRAKTLFIGEEANKLSPWGKINEREVKYGTKTNRFYSIFGVAILEYIDLYKKYSKTPNQESYALQNICMVELGEGKEHYEGSLHDLYKNDYKKFIRYNIRDVELVFMLEQKLGLVALATMLAYANKVNYEDVFMQVRMWDSICYDYLRRRGIIVPPKEDKVKSRANEGAFVKHPKSGRYGHGASFDLDGLYPHLIMMYNISPETLVEDYELPEEVAKWRDQNLLGLSAPAAVAAFASEKLDFSLLKKYNLTITPNGAIYRRDILGFLPEIMDVKYQERKKYKNLMLAAKRELEVETDSTKKKDLSKKIAKFDNWQSALKITLNSAYGAIANEWFRMYDMRNAEAITLSGQVAVKWIEKRLNGFMNGLLKTDGIDYIIAIDTDSVYIDFSAVVDKALSAEERRDPKKAIRMLDKFCEKHIQPFIEQQYKALAEYLNANHKMNMKREALFDSAIWTSKKHYILNVYNNEGVEYNKPKLKIVGMEAIKSSYPKVAREAMKEAFVYILAKDLTGLRDYVEHFRSEFRSLPVVQIASPRSCNDLASYADPRTIWGFKCPPHVRGALVYNHHIKGQGLEKKYEFIKEGEKVRYMYLKEPNPLQTDIISFVDGIPTELGVGQYLDYETQFDKVFLDPLNIVIHAVGWKLEEEGSLESLFG